MRLFKLDSNDPSMNATVLTGGEWVKILTVLDPIQNMKREISVTIGLTEKDGSETAHEVSASITSTTKLSAEVNIPFISSTKDEQTFEVFGGWKGAWKKIKEAVNSKSKTDSITFEVDSANGSVVFW